MTTYFVQQPKRSDNQLAPPTFPYRPTAHGNEIFHSHHVMMPRKTDYTQRACVTTHHMMFCFPVFFLAAESFCDPLLDTSWLVLCPMPVFTARTFFNPPRWLPRCFPRPPKVPFFPYPPLSFSLCPLFYIPPFPGSLFILLYFSGFLAVRKGRSSPVFLPA